MDKKPKKELVDGIRDFLKDLEEPYDSKEWKRFERHRKARKRRIIPPFIKLTAAAVCIGFMVYASVRILPFLNSSKTRNKPVTTGTSKPDVGNNQRPVNTSPVDTLESVMQPPDVPQTSAAQQTNRRSPLRASPRLPAFSNSSSANAPEEVLGPSDSIDPQWQAHKAPFQPLVLPPVFGRSKMWLPAMVGRASNLQLPAGVMLSGKARGQGDRHNDGQIQAGVLVDLGFSDKGLYYGGGGFVHLPLMGRLSLEAGVTYGRITVGSDSTADRSDTLSLQQVGIRHALGKIAVPLSLHYQFSAGFSASVGIAPFMVLSDRRTDMYQSYKWVPSSGNPPSNGSPGRIVSNRRNVHYADTAYKKDVYVGFVRLSAQVSPPFLRAHNLSVAPYIAIPVGPLKQDKYTWVNGGVSLRMYFGRRQ